MATYTVTTNANEERAIAWLLAKENANRVEAGQSTITAEQLVDGIVRRVLISGLRDVRADDADRVRRAYDAANNATQASVKTTLGVS